MYPDLLEIFGVMLYGVVFERILWGILSGLMIWGCVSSIVIFRKGRKAEGLIQGGIVLAILIWAGQKLLSTFDVSYQLVFNEPLIVHSYAFCILVGVCLGILTAMKMAKSRGLSGSDIAKLCLWLIVLGFLGARAAHVIVDWEPYFNACFHPEVEGLRESDCLRVLNLGEGGLTFYGGVIAGMAVVTTYFVRRYRRGVPAAVFSHLDALAGALAISHAFGRLGCLAAGCCWGAITTGTIGVRYGADSFAFAELVKNPELHDAMMKSGETPLLHATQIYESVGELVLYGVLWAMICKKVRPGIMVGFWFIAYGLLRFFVEIMRDDAERGYYFEKTIDSVNEFFNVVPGHSTILSTSQGIGLVMIAIGVGLLVVSRVVKEDVLISSGDGHAVAEREGEKAVEGRDSVEREGEKAVEACAVAESEGEKAVEVRDSVEREGEKAVEGRDSVEREGEKAVEVRDDLGVDVVTRDEGK